MVKSNDCYMESNKQNPAWHKKSIKYAINNNIIKNGTVAKFIFKKSQAKGGYRVQKSSFNKLLKNYLNKKGLKISKKICSNKKNVDFETLSFKVVSK